MGQPLLRGSTIVGHPSSFLSVRLFWLQFDYIARCFTSGPHQECIELGGSLASHARQDMAVGIQGERDLRMPKTLLDDLGMDTLSQQQCCCSMSEVVKPDRRESSLL